MTAAPWTLPGPMSFDDWEVFRATPARWLPAALDIAKAHGRSGEGAHVFEGGTNLLVALGDVVLKVFPPMLRNQFDSERACLTQLRGQLPVPTPDLHFEGEREGWTYLGITRLAGETGEAVWPSLSEAERVRLMFDIGALIAAVQAVPLGPLRGLEPRWADFWPRQLARCVAHHQGRGLPEPLLRELPAFVDEARTLVPDAPEPALLTGEYIPENFLLTRGADGWRLSGLIDFGDAMTGYCEYDLLGPSVFMGGADPARIDALLSSYGYGPDARTPTLRRRLLALYLMHRFSEPTRQIRIPGWESHVRTLDDLGALLWPW